MFDAHGNGDEALLRAYKHRESARARRRRGAAERELAGQRRRTAAAWRARTGAVRSCARGVPGSGQGARAALLIQQYALRFDVELMASAMCCWRRLGISAEADFAFPKARLIADVNDMRDDETACVVIASVKNAERAREDQGRDVGAFRQPEHVVSLSSSSAICSRAHLGFHASRTRGRHSRATRREGRTRSAQE